ncbi:hypothetical protein EV187_1135 [Agromyces ramosus]|uniref:Uncharacterized protein n=1 Tax=Agromyces ramosus TaxID=33879 RepID=A0A4V2F044_9MICO|nr:hypothetical protein EV187_1135 [Agromyces ramosus]
MRRSRGTGPRDAQAGACGSAASGASSGPGIPLCVRADECRHARRERHPDDMSEDVVPSAGALRAPARSRQIAIDHRAGAHARTPADGSASGRPLTDRCSGTAAYSTNGAAHVHRVADLSDVMLGFAAPSVPRFGPSCPLVAASCGRSRDTLEMAIGSRLARSRQGRCWGWSLGAARAAREQGPASLAPLNGDPALPIPGEITRVPRECSHSGLEGAPRLASARFRAVPDGERPAVGGVFAVQAPRLAPGGPHRGGCT